MKRKVRIIEMGDEVYVIKGRDVNRVVSGHEVLLRRLEKWGISPHLVVYKLYYWGHAVATAYIDD